jgi:hypothetical protein
MALLNRRLDAISKSFLFLFFKKEILPCFCNNCSEIF